MTDTSNTGVSSFAEPVDFSATDLDPIGSVDPVTGQLKTGDVSDFAEPIGADGSSGIQKASAFGRSALGSTLEVGGIAGGMMLGAQVGALGGPAAPVTVPLGAGVGAIAGYFAGKGARKALSKVKTPLSNEALTTERVEDLPPDQRPFGFAGEVVGGGGVITGATRALAVTGARLAPSMAGNLINRILDTAAQSPKLFTAVEASALASSAAAAGAAEAVAPGETGIRIGAEVAGGLVNPPRAAIGLYRTVVPRITKFASSFSQAAANTRAGQILSDALEEAGEDPSQILEALKAADLPGVDTTAAAKTGSPALAALEKDMIEQSREFGNLAHKQTKDSIEAISEMIELLRGTGDPLAVRAAAEIRAEKFRMVLQNNVDTAQAKAIQAAEGISKDDPTAVATLSVNARNILETSMKDARSVERELWSAVDGAAEAAPKTVLARHSELRGGMLPAEKMPQVIRDTIKGWDKAAKTLAKVEAGEKVSQKAIDAAEEQFTTGFLLKFRTRTLALAREAAAKPGGANEARLYGQLAEAALEDLSDGFRGLEGADEAYEIARTFSREFNDVYTRTFAGAAQRSGTSGADRLPPELLLRRALGTGKEAGALRLEELEEATRFLPTRELGGPEAAQRVETMLDAQQRLLRLAAADTIDPQTGKVNPRSLALFMRNNAELMERFPNIARDLKTAQTSAEGLTAMERLQTTASAIASKRAAFGRIIRSESPADAIQGAVARSQNPVRNLTDMARLARASGQEAVEGYKAAVWDYAMQRAERMGGSYIENLVNTLTGSMRPGLPSLLGVMQREGILAAGDVQSLQKLISRMRTIAQAVTTPGTGELIGGVTDAATDLVLRVAGARLGTAGAGLIGGAGNAGTSLIAAGTGSKFARAVFDRIPAARVKDTVGMALSDPKFAAKLLETPATQAGQIEQAMQLHAYLIQAGVTAFTTTPESTTLKKMHSDANPAPYSISDEGINTPIHEEPKLDPGAFFR